MTSRLLPFLTIVIPTYNEQERLFNAVNSLSKQEYPANLAEIIVIDDASPESINEQSLTRGALPFELKVFRNCKNQGRARSRNTGIQNASGEIIVFLDSDMTVTPNFLSAHAEFHQNKSAAIGIGNIVWANEIPDNSLTRYVSNRGVHQTSISDEVPFKCFVTGNSSVPKTLLNHVGLFDEDFRTYGGEDLELGVRLHLSGAHFFYLPEALSHHHHLRPLKQFCKLMYEYGLSSLPILIEKQPVLKELLRLSFLQEPKKTIKSTLFNLALNRPIYWTILSLTNLGMKYYVPDLFFDYIIWYNRTRGYLESSAQKD